MSNGRNAYLDYIARCNQAFRPFAPVDLPDFFKGRANDIDLLRSELAKPGRHVAIFGERGVGKTSLATLAYFFAGFDDQRVAFIRCDHTSTYDSIFGQALQHAGIQYVPNGMEVTRTRTGGASLGPVSATGARHRSTRFQATDSARAITPAALLKVFGNQRGLIILDEYDRVEDAATHTRLAETLKHFSDAASATKLIVVGVAGTLAELVGQHTSITRCLAEVKLKRMTSQELLEIIATAEERLGVVFKEEIKHRIVGLSDGFPFYTHLLGGYAAEFAGRILEEKPEARVVIAEQEYRASLRKAIETAEGTLHDQYQKATITVVRKTEMYARVLWGVAYSSEIEVQVNDISQNIGLLFGDRPTAGSLNNYLGPLVKHDRGDILTRVRQGYYKFTNPLMRAYVRLNLEEHNVLELNGQMQFPWMRK